LSWLVQVWLVSTVLLSESYFFFPTNRLVTLFDGNPCSSGGFPVIPDIDVWVSEEIESSEEVVPPRVQLGSKRRINSKDEVEEKSD
jgi:hypothetical protein